VENIRLEKVGNLSNIVGLQFLFIGAAFYLKIDIKEIFSSVVLIHANIIELELDYDVVIG
jgi:hypothetical protein